MELFCAPDWIVGLIGSLFIVGIVVGCMTLTRMGDIVGRRPIYLIGLVLHIFALLAMLVNTEVWVGYILLFVSGLSITARYYVGYTYNLEM